MNTAMWENAITQQNVKTLLTDPRYRTVGPASGLLADGDSGAGRLAEPDVIVKAAEAFVANGPLQGKRVLLTAGPTREHLDPVRFISNPSTGKMGLAVAHAARALGAEVTVVLGPVPSAERGGLEIIDVTTAEQMRDSVLAQIEDADYFIATAAVSDYKPATVAAQKLKKSEGDEAVTFVRTPDVLAEASRKVTASAKRPVLVGFAAETERVIEHALQKLVAKNLDFIVANDVSAPGVGFGGDSNTVTVLARGGQRVEASGTKREVAETIWKALLDDSSNHITVSVDG
jgi:phosphopantothenoylcysteine decarboxylase/phosphopantothenate--cysteine ligase